MKRNPPGLTARQSEVLELLARGKSIKEIGDALHISPRTVEFHLERMKQELGAKGRAELLAYAWRHGLVGHSKSHTVLLNDRRAIMASLMQVLVSALASNPETSQTDACDALQAEIEKLRAAKLPAPMKSQLLEAALSAEMKLWLEKLPPLVICEAKYVDYDALFSRWTGTPDAVS